MAQRTLTDADIEALTEAIKGAIKGHSVCNMGLTPEEVSVVKRLIHAFDKASGIVGTVVLTAIVLAVIAIFSKGFWASLIAGGVKTTTIGR